MKIGYVRITPTEPDVAAQQIILKNAGCKHIFQEPIHDNRRERPVLETALGYLRADDTLVVCRFVCLAWSLTHLLKVVDCINQKQANLHVMHENIDTSTSDGADVFQLFAALQTFNHDIARERTRIGLAAARARGRKGGRPKGLSDMAKRKAVLAEQFRKEGILSTKQICRELSISKNTYYRYLRHQGVKI